MDSDAPTSPSRRRLIVPGMLAAAVILLGYGVWWLSSARAISFTGTGGGGPVGLSVLKPLDQSEFIDASDAPPAYGWHQGGYVYEALIFHNSLSVPVTITGVAQPPVYSTTFLVGPQLRRPKPGVGFASTPSQSEPASSVHVGAGGDAELDLLWRAVGRCGRFAVSDPHQTRWAGPQTITFHYQIVPFIGETQEVAIGQPSVTDEEGMPADAFDVVAPRATDCPAGYPHPVN